MLGYRMAMMSGAAFVGAVLVSTPALAQTTPDQTTVLEDIVVTALKRETNLQSTPATVDVVGGQSLQNSGVTNIDSIAALAPALNFGKANGIYTLVTIRGVSSQDTTELGSPATTFSIDGETINRPVNLAASLFDISRVEVLRGPQGTLYGRNATAGAVNIITNKPDTSEFSASVTGNIGNYEQVGAQGYVNIPIEKDVAALRLSGIFSQHDGYTDTARGRVLDDEDLLGARARLLLTPTERLSAIVTAEYIRSRSGGPNSHGVVVNGPFGSVPTTSTVASPSESFASLGIDPRLDTNQKDLRAEVSYDFGAAKLTDIIGYRRSDFTQLQDYTGQPAFGIDFAGHGEYKTFSNELRLSNGADSPIDWQVGYYYFNEKQIINSSVFAAVPFAVRGQNPLLHFLYPSVREISHGVFGEVTFPLGHDVSLTGGLRYSVADKERDGTQDSLDIPAFAGSGGAVVQYARSSTDGETHEEKLTYNAVLAWQATDRNYLYAKLSTGFKAGGFTTTNVYGPENLTAFEIGSKNRFGSFQLNVNGFYYDYKDQQVLTTDRVTLLPTTENAGKSRSWGIETSAIYRISSADTLTASVDYLNAEFTQFIASAAAFGPTTVTLDLKGNTPPFAPKWTVGLSYTHDFAFAWGDVKFQATSAYKSSFYTSVFNYLPQRQDGFVSTNLTLGYTAPSSGWTVLGYVNNLENERVLTNSTFGTRGGNNFFIWQYGAPRTAGVRLTFNF